MELVLYEVNPSDIISLFCDPLAPCLLHIGWFVDNVVIVYLGVKWGERLIRCGEVGKNGEEVPVTCFKIPVA